MRIGILGGTFNPIHVGHLILAENAYTYLNLDKILFIPSNISYMKNQAEILSTEHRIQMLKLAIEGNEHFELSLIEIERGGYTYTYETLSALKSQNPNDEFYFIGGADTMYSLPSWKCPDVIFNLCTLVIAPRNDSEYEELMHSKQNLIDNYQARIEILNTPNIEISSSMLRTRIGQGKSVKYYIPHSVERYIKEHKLYGQEN